MLAVVVAHQASSVSCDNVEIIVPALLRQRCPAARLVLAELRARCLKQKGQLQNIKWDTSWRTLVGLLPLWMLKYPQSNIMKSIPRLSMLATQTPAWMYWNIW